MIKDSKELLLKLVSISTAEEVTELLESEKFFTQAEWWPLGDNDSNFSIVSTQQSDPINALVEKIVNSIDALLMRECIRRGIDPTDPVKAPSTMKDAVETFFEIPDADISKLPLRRRREIAESIRVIAEGPKDSPSIIIADSGEGQCPEDFDKTFLSLPSSKSNKLNVTFVQGKFNMGGTGALMFCGDERQKYQLILSRRHTQIAGNGSLWGFTLVRESIKPRSKMPVFEYLCDKNGKVFSFNSKPLPILPGGEVMREGSLVKLYSYYLPNPSNINLDLWRDLNRKLYIPALPIMTYETRYESKAIHGPSRIMVGNAFRVAREDHEWVEEAFQIKSDLGKFGNREIEITLFKDEITKTVRGYPQTRRFKSTEFTSPSEAIFLTVNGQTHHTIGRSLLKAKANLKNVADYLMIHIDVSNLEAEANEIFHGSRERVRRNKIYCDFEERLLSDLKDNPLLRSWDEEYRRRKLSKVQPDMHFVKRSAARILSRNPAWARKLDLGKGLSIPIPEGKKPALFKGRYTPTFLKLRGDSVKKVPINNKYSWAYLETDAQNDYLTREKDAGEFIVSALPEVEKSFWLRDGLVSLKIVAPKSAKAGSSVSLDISLSRPEDKPLTEKVKVVYTEPREKVKGKPSRRTPSREEYNLPEPDPVKKDRWAEFGWGSADISMFDGSVIRINMDSYDLHEFLRQFQTKFKPETIMKAYQTAIYLYTFILDNELSNRDDKDEIVPKVMKGISKIVLPLNFEEILEEVE